MVFLYQEVLLKIMEIISTPQVFNNPDIFESRRKNQSDMTCTFGRSFQLTKIDAYCFYNYTGTVVGTTSNIVISVRCNNVTVYTNTITMNSDGLYSFTLETPLDVVENQTVTFRRSTGTNSATIASVSISGLDLETVMFPSLSHNPKLNSSYFWGCRLYANIDNYIWKSGGYPQLNSVGDLSPFKWSINKDTNEPTNQGVWRFKDEKNQGYPFIILPLEPEPKPSDSLYKKIPSSVSPEGPSKSEYIPYEFYVKTETGLVPILISQKK